MTISNLNPAGTAPSSDRDTWAAPLAMRANWKNPVTVRTGFQTTIEQALTLSEQRRLLRGTPRRSLSCTLTGVGRASTLSARQLLTRRSMAGFLMPLYSDQIELDADLSIGQDTPSGDTSYRRIFAGKRALLIGLKHEQTTHFEEVEIDSVGASSVTLTAAVTKDYPKGSLLIPLFEARLVDNYSNGFVITDDKADFQNFTAQEAVGSTQIDGIETVGGNPSGYDVFDSLPVFSGPIDYSQIRFGINRIGSYSNAGIDLLPVFYGERGPTRLAALLNCTSRQQAWDFIRFFESRGGRAYPFYFPSPWEDYKITGTNGNNLLVEDTGDLLDWNYRPYLAMELDDGTFDYREIATVTQNGSNHEISFVGGAALGSVSSARQLFKMRMFRDEIAERWLTTDRCQMTLEMVELLEEKQIQLIDTLATHTGDSVVDENGDEISVGISPAIGDDTTTAISPDLNLGGCEGMTYELTHCDTGEKIYTNTDLSDNVGEVVELESGCYEVIENWVPGNPISAVTVLSTAATCETCGAVCTDDGSNCSSCTDTDELKYKVTFSEINLCWPYCSGTELYDWASGFGDATLNTEHTLTQVSGCVWEKSIPLAAAYITNSDQCGGSSSAESTENILIRLTRNASTWDLQVEIVWFSSEIIYLFQNTQNEDGAGVCASIPAFSNDNTTCSHSTGAGPSNAGIHGTGGTATVTCSPLAPCSCPSGLASSYTLTATGTPCSGETDVSFALTGTCPTWTGAPAGPTSVDADLTLETSASPDCHWQVVLRCDIGGGDDQATYEKADGASPEGTYTRTVDGSFASFPSTITIT